MVVTSSNLTLQERLQLPENLTGKSVLSSDSNTLYAISESGVTVLPVGSLAQQPQVVAQQEDLVFRGSFCNQGVSTQQITIVDPGGNNTPFSISSDTAGVSVSTGGGVTPAVVTVSVDPSAFLNQTGTVAAHLAIQSGPAINVIPSVRVLVNNAGPNQVGSFIDVPGTLTDIVADPVRNQFYVVRSDKNEVLVFDGTQLFSNRHASDRQPAHHHGHLLRPAVSAGGQPRVANRQRIRSRYLASQTRRLFCLRASSRYSIASSANATLAQGGYYDGTFHILQLDIPSAFGNSVALARRVHQRDQRQHRIDRLAERFFDPDRSG